MLNALHISNVVLIDRLDLEFDRGLSVLTGETGAGKSILLDALSLALGARTDTSLVRHGTDTANVIAEFSIEIKNPNFAALSEILTEQDIESDGNLTLRRSLSADGKSRAWVNDLPVSIKVLKNVGDALVEIHGQFENHTLLDQTTHITSLDEYGKVLYGNSYPQLLADISGIYAEWRTANKKLIELQEILEKSAAEKEFLEYNVKELSALAPQIGEEAELSTRRAQLMDMEKNSAILREATDAFAQNGHNIDENLFDIAHILERIKTDPNPYQAQIDNLYEIGNAAAEIAGQIAPKDGFDINELESAEERLFALRAAARKHRVTPDELPDKLQSMTEQLAAIDDRDSALSRLTSELALKKSKFDKVAAQLHDLRITTAEKLHKEILHELPDLKLGQADFMVEISSVDARATGTDNVTFLIKTNPGTPFAPLNKIASGGELARFMLALRVVLSHGNNAKTFIFDELDSGISGATATAVGERLNRLAKSGQALVITHSAQVAGFGDKHFLIQKNISGEGKDKITTTSVSEITGDNRLQEIARIVSGKKITKESIATAKTLIK